jgi:hypothetical protein
MSVPPMHPHDIARAMGDHEATGRRYIRRHRLVKDSPETTPTSAGAVAIFAVIAFVMVIF